MVLVCSDDEVVPDSEVSDGNISDAFTDTIPVHNQHPEYNPDVHDPQTPGTSYQNVLNITDLTKSKSAQPNEDLHNMIERR